MKSCKNLKGGLQEVADQLEIRRLGPQHQAGSDALLTGMAFFKMREVYTQINEFCLNWNSIYTKCQFNKMTWHQFQHAQLLDISFHGAKYGRTKASGLGILPQLSICLHPIFHIPNTSPHEPQYVFTFSSPYSRSYHWPFPSSKPRPSILSPNAMAFVPSRRRYAILSANIRDMSNLKHLAIAEDLAGAQHVASAQHVAITEEVAIAEEVLDSNGLVEYEHQDLFAGGDHFVNNSCVRFVVLSKRTVSAKPLSRVFLSAPYRKRPVAKNVHARLEKKDKRKLKLILNANVFL